MSEEEKDGPDQAAKRIIPLLKEFAHVFQSIAENMRGIQEGYSSAKRSPIAPDFLKSRAEQDYQGEMLRLNRLEPAARQLAQQASQLAEQGKADTVTRVEIVLRLAELEAAIERARYRVGMGFVGQ